MTQNTSLLGDRLRKYRLDLGLSAEKLADSMKERNPKSKFTQAIITNIENGRKTEVTINELIELALALRVTPLALVVDMEQPYKESDIHCLQGHTNEDVWNWFTASNAQDMTFDGNVSVGAIRIGEILAAVMPLWSLLKNYETVQSELLDSIMKQPDRDESGAPVNPKDADKLRQNVKKETELLRRSQILRDQILDKSQALKKYHVYVPPRDRA